MHLFLLVNIVDHVHSENELSPTESTVELLSFGSTLRVIKFVT